MLTDFFIIYTNNWSFISQLQFHSQYSNSGKFQELKNKQKQKKEIP